MEHGTKATLASLPIELLGMIVNGRDRHGCAFMDPRWRPMARMSCRLLRGAVENPTLWDAHDLGDPERLFRRRAIHRADGHRDEYVAHARRNRWHRGMLVCASIAAEWVAGASGVLDAAVLQTLADRMAGDWGASRAEAHVALLASDRPEAIAHALDPRSSAAFVVAHPFAWAPFDYRISYGPSWLPDARELGYAMLEVAARRCSVGTVRGAVDAIDASLWARGYLDQDDGDEVRGLERASLRTSVLAFDRDDLIGLPAMVHAVGCGLACMVTHGAVRCVRRQIDAATAAGASSLAISKSIAAGAHDWMTRRGPCALGVDHAAEIDDVLDAAPRGIIAPNHLREILLIAVRGDAVATATWALAAMGRGLSADDVLEATNLSAVELMQAAVGCALDNKDVACVLGSRAAAWLCDLLAYTPAVSHLPILVNACVRQTRPGRGNWSRCSVARVAFMLARWPHALWESRTGVDLVRGAFSSYLGEPTLERDIVLLIDAVEAWCEAIGVERQMMRQTLGLRTVVLAHANVALLARIVGVWCDDPWDTDCSAVCYGACARKGPCAPPSATAPEMPFCNGRARSDADTVMAWCMPDRLADLAPP